MPMEVFILSLFLGQAPGEAQENRDQAREALARARDLQGEALRALDVLLSGHERRGSASELLSAISTIHGLQLGLVRSSRSMVALTFGRTLGSLSAEEKGALEKLAGEARSVSRRLGEFLGSLEKLSGGDGAPAGLRNIMEKAMASRIAETIDGMAQEIEGGKLSEASRTGRGAADETANLQLGLEEVLLSPEDLRDLRIQALRDLLEGERGIRAALGAGKPSREEWRRALREEAELGDRVRPLTFEGSGLPPAALEGVRTAHRFMEDAQDLMRKEDRGALVAIDAAIEALMKAVDALAAAAQEEGTGITVPAPISPRLIQGSGGTPILLGSPGGGGVDTGALAQLAADIAGVVRLREKQARILAETKGGKSPGSELASRELSLAGEAAQLVRRVEVYLPPAASAIGDGRIAMEEAGNRLRSGDLAGAAPEEEKALDRLGRAERSLREFWLELIKTLERITKTVESGPSHGASAGGEEEGRETRLLVLLRELARVGRLIQEEDLLIQKTERWVAEPPGEAGAGEVAAAAKSQAALAERGRDIARELEAAGEEAGSLREAVSEASEFLAGAGEMLERSRFEKALEREEAAMEYLESAWQAIAESAASVGGGARQGGEEKARSPGSGESGGAAGASSIAGSKPWWFDLPPRAREAVRQSLEGRFPARYEASIRRYYERLSAGKKEGR